MSLGGGDQAIIAGDRVKSVDAGQFGEPPSGAITDQHGEHDHDRFDGAHPDTHWQYAVAHAKKIGLGTDEYELVTL